MFTMERDNKVLYADLTEDQFGRLTGWLPEHGLNFEAPNPTGSDPQYWVEVHDANAEHKTAIARILG